MKYSVEVFPSSKKGVMALIEDVITTRLMEGDLVADAKVFAVILHALERNSETLTLPNPEKVGVAM